MFVQVGLGLGFQRIPSIGFDADAQAFFDRVTTAGGTLSTTEKTAVNQLVLDMKSANIWTAMKAVYPMVGSSAAACAQNLKSSSFTSTFTSGWTFASSGATPNGTSAYIDTNFIPSTNFSGLNNKSFGVYIGTNVASGTDIGSLNSSFVGDQLITRTNTNIYGSSNSGGETSYTTNPNSDSRGFWISSRLISANFYFYRNGVNIQTGGSSITQNNFSMLIAVRRVGSSIDAGQYTSKRYQFVFLGDGLTDTQASNFYTAVQAFQTTLSRQV